MTLFFLRTCVACPEQYDVYTTSGEQVGYVRLRYGNLIAFYPKYGGDIIYQYEFKDRYKGCFDDDTEREIHINKIMGILKHLLYADNVDCNYIITDDYEGIS